MGEGQTLMKVILILGVLAVLFSLLAEDSRGPGEISAWNDLTVTLETGIQFPAFDDPFVGDVYSFRRIPTSNGTDDLPSSVSGCTIAAYFECVQFQNDGRYIELEPGDLVTVNVTDLPGPDRIITDIIVRFVCRTNGTSESAVFFYHETPLAPDVVTGAQFSIPCSIARNETVAYSFGANDPATTARWQWDEIDVGWEIGVEIDSDFNSEPVRIDYMEAEVFYQEIVTCTAVPGAWFPWIDEQACSIGQFTQAIVKGFQFGFNGVGFILVSVGAIFLFVGSVLGGFILGVLGVATFMFNIPGAPPQVTGIFVAVFAALIGFVFFVVVKIIRGGGPV